MSSNMILSPMVSGELNEYSPMVSPAMQLIPASRYLYLPFMLLLLTVGLTFVMATSSRCVSMEVSNMTTAVLDGMMSKIVVQK